MRHIALAAVIACVLLAGAQVASGHNGLTVEFPRIEMAGIAIDGDISDWEDLAYTDGVWTFDRMTQQPWAGPANELLDDGTEGGAARTSADLSAEYFMAWNNDGFLMGAKVKDNVHDTSTTDNNAAAWYFRDGVSWYWDPDHDAGPNTVLPGDHVITFTAHPKPNPIEEGPTYYYGSVEAGGQIQVWGTDLPAGLEWEVILDPVTGTDYTIEAFMPFVSTFNLTTPKWIPPFEGKLIGFITVHPDADGGATDWGGQLTAHGLAPPDVYADAVLLSAGAVAVETTSWSVVKQLFK